MPARVTTDADRQSPTERASRSLAALLALVVLLQALWLPFHLASEAHVPIGGDMWLAAATGAGARLVASATAADEDHGHHPHSVLDHQSAKQARDERRLPPSCDDAPGGAVPVGPQVPLALPDHQPGAAWSLAPPPRWAAPPASRPQTPRAPPLG